MSLSDRYNPAAFSFEEDDNQMAVPMYREGIKVNLKFTWLPKSCSLTGRRLWLKKAYRTSERYTGTDGSGREVKITYVHWVDKYEYIKWKLKNE